MTTPDSDEIMTVKDVAEYLKFSESTIYRMANRGDLPGQKIGGAWRFSKKGIVEGFRKRPFVEKKTFDFSPSE